MSQRTVKLGDTVFTIGFQNQQSQVLGAKLTDGKINSLADALNDARVFQISLPVQADNCGGALVTSSGNVVGVIAAQVYDKATCNTNGASEQNINYAIKSSYVLSLLESLPEVANKLKEPSSAKEHKFEDLVKEALEAAAVVQVY
jgi:S1-C subfamily serine protease